MSSEAEGTVYDRIEKLEDEIATLRNEIDVIKNALENFSKDDIVIYSDNDEIPDLKNFDFKDNKKKFVTFKQKIFYYKFNLKLPNLIWTGTKACKKKDLKSIDYDCPKELNALKSISRSSGLKTSLFS